MTVGTTTLNPGTGGDEVLNDALTTVDGAAAPASAVAQIVKAAYGAQGAAELVTPTKGMPVTQVTTGTHFQPGFDTASGPGQGGALRMDPDGNLVARAQVLTDELGYRANFANSSLAVSIGTATFTNGSRDVVGTGFIAADLRTGDYVKLDADAESAWVQVGELNSDTNLTLIDDYTGTGGTGASSRAIVKPVTGAGATISVSNGQCVIAAGTTAGSISKVERDVDWLPLIKQAGVSVSQRIINQSTYIGFYDEAHPATPYWFAWFLLDGTVNTTVKCLSGRNPTQAPSVAETEETVVTLPNGGTSATVRRWRPEVLGDRVNFFIDGVLVATHYRAMPGPGDLLTSTVRVVNGGTAPASNTSVTIDFDTVKNHNKIEIGLLSDAETVAAAQPPAQMYNFSQAGVITINTDLLVIDCSQLRSLSVHCTAMGTTGVVTPAWSNDGTNWVTATMMSEAGATSTTFNAAALRTTSVRARYFRLRLTTATTAGTTTIAVAGFQADLTPAVTTQTISGTVTANQGTMAALPAGTNAIGAVRLTLPEVTTDVASAAITTTATTAAFTPASGVTYEVNIPVTVMTGTTPTLDVSIEESDDSGTNWFRVYEFPRITATGIYRSPKLQLTGNRVRYVQTVGGTTPSFTRSINRLVSSEATAPLRQIVNRSIDPVTLNSTTPSLDVRNCRNLQLLINLGAATTPPAIQMEGSDDNGASWYAIGSPLTGVASSTVQLTVNNVQAALVRGRISTVGATVTLGYVMLKGF